MTKGSRPSPMSSQDLLASRILSCLPPSSPAQGSPQFSPGGADHHLETEPHHLTVGWVRTGQQLSPSLVSGSTGRGPRGGEWGGLSLIFLPHFLNYGPGRGHEGARRDQVWHGPHPPAASSQTGCPSQRLRLPAGRRDGCRARSGVLRPIATNVSGGPPRATNNPPGYGSAVFPGQMTEIQDFWKHVGVSAHWFEHSASWARLTGTLASPQACVTALPSTCLRVPAAPGRGEGREVGSSQLLCHALDL